MAFVGRKVKILSCSRNPKRNGEMASVTVTWDLCNLLLRDETKFELKFVEIADQEPSHVITVRNIGFRPCDDRLAYTVDKLDPNTTYSITVTFQGKPESESESMIVHTLEGVQCDPFLFSSSEKSRDVFVDRTHKELNFLRYDHCRNHIYSRALGLARGTVMALHHTRYWEVEVSYPLPRYFRNGEYIACVGISADFSLNVKQHIEDNYYFYGVAVGKDERGSPVIFTLVEGRQYGKYPVKTERYYKKKFGFLYNDTQSYLVIVNTEQNSIILQTRKLKRVMDDNSAYSPVFSLGDGTGNPSMKIFTGPDITNIPNCLQKHLE